jgi:hypothetical protein|tara:strand:+ start:1360 stop:1788 length:429 start_codon:yes stop_codon:yes gene_type:complete
MNYVYKNITTTVPQILIQKDDGGVTTIHKCQIANVDSSDATVGVYIESFSEDSTIKVHGSKESNYNSITDDYVNKENQKIYYQIKNVVIPVGSTLVLFTDHPCSHDSRFQFVIETTHRVDVILDYEQSRARSTTANRNINQY